MTELLIVCAMENEAARLINILGAVKNGSGDYVSPDRRRVITVCGVGKVNAAAQTSRAIAAYSPAAAVNAGISGGLDRRLEVLSAVVCDEVRYHDVSPEWVLEKYPPHRVLMPCDPTLKARLAAACVKNGTTPRHGRAVCGDMIVTDPELSAQLAEKLGGSCVDMESAAVAHTCALFGVPFAALRVISDFADENALPEMEKQEYKAAELIAAVIKNI